MLRQNGIPTVVTKRVTVRLTLLRLLVGAACALATCCGLTVLSAYGFLHPGRNPVTANLRDFRIPYEDVRFRSAEDPLTLRAWYIPAAGHPRGVVIFCHGYGGDRSAVLWQAMYLHNAGFGLFAFDFRDSGDSEGDMSTIGWREVGDALGAVRYLEARPDTKNLPLGVFGTSMGAAVAIQLAAQVPEIRCVVADSPYATLDSAINSRFHGMLGSSSNLFRAPIEFAGEYMMGKNTAEVSPLAVIAKIAPRPIFLIHGTADQICSPEDSRRLYRATNGNATLWLVPGAGHIGAISVAPKEYERRVTAFFKANLR